MYGWNLQKPTKQDENDTTILSLHLVPFCQLCLVFLSCVHRRVMEDSGVTVVLGVQSMYVDVQGESVMLWVAAE